MHQSLVVNSAAEQVKRNKWKLGTGSELDLLARMRDCAPASVKQSRIKCTVFSFALKLPPVYCLGRQLAGRPAGQQERKRKESSFAFAKTRRDVVSKRAVGAPCDPYLRPLSLFPSFAQSICAAPTLPAKRVPLKFALARVPYARPHRASVHLRDRIGSESDSSLSVGAGGVRALAQLRARATATC